MHQATSTSFFTRAAAGRGRQRRARFGPDALTVTTRASERLEGTAHHPARVLGPYANGKTWRLVLLDGTSRKSFTAPTLQSALALKTSMVNVGVGIVDPTLSRRRRFGDALNAYLAEQTAQGFLLATVQNIRVMLQPFLPRHTSISSISTERAADMYRAETQRLKQDGKPIAPDTHHLWLRRVKLFYRWALSRRLVTSNPFAEVRPIGRRKYGKPQLRIDEARCFVSAALPHARNFDVGATAALIQIFLGLRPTEALIRVVRDLDDDGHVLWVPFGKTPNARRRLEVPNVLREVLLRHAAGKSAEAPLLGPPGEMMHSRHTLYHRLPLLCADAGVPRVCPHSLRGLSATLALDAGAIGHNVAVSLGHASFSTTARHYADASIIVNEKLRRLPALLASRSETPLELSEVAGLLRTNLSSDERRRLVTLLSAV